jgi:catechol 2,3-dioxygenase-like lactoylglutathione lyase family enzyme
VPDSGAVAPLSGPVSSPTYSRSSLYHVGLWTNDHDAAIRFYLEAFDGKLLTVPFELSGERAERLYRTPGVRMLVCHIEFPDGGGVELCRPLAPSREMPLRESRNGIPLPHVGLRMKEIERAYAAVEPAGGRILSDLIWSVSPDSGRMVFFCEDPDGNVVEVVTSGFEESIALIHATRPESVPPGF